MRWLVPKMTPLGFVRKIEGIGAVDNGYSLLLYTKPHRAAQSIKPKEIETKVPGKDIPKEKN
ncbi:hypothetical protein F2Q68_00007317 [Brassica cretica]|uniref:Uncharacterized protein n=1 Tax=Brassica cretica TaxID=69181 RepID=A0A8S9KUD6_BRACR|nr:hypothetical protein F2Q68_00007317 [Brassica cretica]